MNPKGIILTGGPNSCYEEGAPTYKMCIRDSYYTPSGKNIHGKGITPDVKIEANGKTDVQLNKALEVLKKK